MKPGMTEIIVNQYVRLVVSKDLANDSSNSEFFSTKISHSVSTSFTRALFSMILVFQSFS